MQPNFTPPLSWKSSNLATPVFKKIDLKLSNTAWLAFADLPYKTDFHSFVSYLRQLKEQNVIMRGCPGSLVKALSESGYKNYLISREAILDLKDNHFEKPSLKELVKRGNRHGQVTEVPSNEHNTKLLDELYTRSPYGKTPRLRNLFRDDFSDETRCFAFRNKRNAWLGALTLTYATPQKVHTELLLRASTAPVGIMEALVHYVFKTLSDESSGLWSLGEVPFITEVSDFTNTKEYVIHKIGELFVFCYNFKGLYRFKNKFNPRWENIYLCGKPDVKYSALVEMAFKCNYFKLLTKSVIRRLLKR